MQDSCDILIVEDNPGDIRLMQELLRESPRVNRIYVAIDGQEAIAFLRGLDRPAGIPRLSLVILDLNLPQKDGFDVLNEIRSDPSLQHVPVVVFSSSTRPDDVRRAYAGNANCYVPKPRTLDGYTEALHAIQTFWVQSSQQH